MWEYRIFNSDARAFQSVLLWHSFTLMLLHYHNPIVPWGRRVVGTPPCSRTPILPITHALQDTKTHPCSRTLAESRSRAQPYCPPSLKLLSFRNLSDPTALMLSNCSRPIVLLKCTSGLPRLDIFELSSFHNFPFLHVRAPALPRIRPSYIHTATFLPRALLRFQRCTDSTAWASPLWTFRASPPFSTCLAVRTLCLLFCTTHTLSLRRAPAFLSTTGVRTYSLPLDIAHTPSSYALHVFFCCA